MTSTCYSLLLQYMRSLYARISHFSHPRIKPSNVYVDAVSMTLLKGATIDFATELIGSSFRVVDNPQVRLSTLWWLYALVRTSLPRNGITYACFRRRGMAAAAASAGSSTFETL